MTEILFILVILKILYSIKIVQDLIYKDKDKIFTAIQLWI